MAKKSKPGPSKSDSIRAYFAENPGAGPTEVAQALASQGITVSIPLVSALKGKLKGGKGKRGRKKGATVRGTKTNKTRKARGDEKVSLNLLLAAKKMAAELGGIERARQAFDLLEKLS